MGKRQENKDKKIKCPNFQKGKQNLCLACPEGLMVPSIHELVTFCLNGQYRNCPLNVRVNSP